MTRMNVLSMVVCAGALAIAPTARADDQDSQPPPPTTMYEYDDSTYTLTTPGTYSYAWREPRLRSEIGVGFVLGGGLTGFTDQTMRQTMSSNVAGLWDLRASIGTHIPIGLDVSYLGTAGDVNTLTGAPNGTLVGTTVEGAVRFNILPHNNINPYMFAGAGWQRYDLTNAKLAQSDTGVKASDNVVEFPMGAGLSFRDLSGFTVDLRGTFRAAADSKLVLDQATGNYAKLHTWEASGALGYEF